MAAGATVRPYIVVYDGHCGVCGRIVERLARWDNGRQLEIVPSQAPGVPQRFPWIDSRAFIDSMQVVRSADGMTWQGAAAIEQLLAVLPRGRRIGWIFHLPLVRGLAERLYRWFARNRYRLGCGEHCRAHPEHGSG